MNKTELMKRRELFKYSALGACALSSLPFLSSADGAEDGYSGPFYVMINAGGGWDPRFHFDPHLEPEQNRLYSSIERIGNISYAPIGYEQITQNFDTERYNYRGLLLTNQEFLEAYGAELLVLNGVDMKTNNHDAGNRAIWSGQLQEGYPSIAALVAAEYANEEPMAFLSAGGCDATSGLVPLTRVGSAGNLQKLAFPNRIDPGNPDSTELYHSDATWRRIREAQAERLNTATQKAELLRMRQSREELRAARLTDRDLQALKLPEELVQLGGYQLGALQRAEQQAQIALAAFKGGLSASVNLSIGGFDTHADHDRDQPGRIAMVWGLVDFLMREAEREGLRDQLVVLIGSDFARGPYYNSERENAGKDHWSIGSFLALGKGIRGNRVIGATDDEQLALPIDPETLEQSQNGRVLTVEDIHLALRKKMQLGTVAEQFPLLGTPMELFS